jgi:hypothetical protein
MTGRENADCMLRWMTSRTNGRPSFNYRNKPINLCVSACVGAVRVMPAGIWKLRPRLRVIN